MCVFMFVWGDAFCTACRTRAPGLHAYVCMFVYLDMYMCIYIAVYTLCLARTPGVDMYVCVYS